MKPHKLQALDMLITALDAVDDNYAEARSALYTMKAKYIQAWGDQDHLTAQENRVVSWCKWIDLSLCDLVREHLIENVSVFTDQNPDYAISGIQYNCKLDTGAKDCSIDAREIKWAGADVAELQEIHLKFATANPNAGFLTPEKLVKHFPEYTGIDFGTIESVKLATHKTKDDKDYSDVLVEKNLPVIGIANPVNTGGKRAGLRPSVELTMQREGSDIVVVQPFSLVDRRSMTMRVLLGKDFLKNQSAMIDYSGNDTRIVNPKALPEIVAKLPEFGLKL